jgi:hypothetical protein
MPGTAPAQIPRTKISVYTGVGGVRHDYHVERAALSDRCVMVPEKWLNA